MNERDTMLKLYFSPFLPLMAVHVFTSTCVCGFKTGFCLIPSVACASKLLKKLDLSGGELLSLRVLDLANHRQHNYTRTAAEQVELRLNGTFKCRVRGTSQRVRRLRL